MDRPLSSLSEAELAIELYRSLKDHKLKRGFVVSHLADHVSVADVEEAMKSLASIRNRPPPPGHLHASGMPLIASILSPLTDTGVSVSDSSEFSALESWVASKAKELVVAFYNNTSSWHLFWKVAKGLLGIRPLTKIIMGSIMSEGFRAASTGLRCDAQGSHAPSYFVRMLPPIEQDRVCNVDPQVIVRALFSRPGVETKYQPAPHNSNVLFPWFAQWFVEQFFKSGVTFKPDLDKKDNECGSQWGANTIDLSTVYGSNDDQTRVLREPAGPLGGALRMKPHGDWGLFPLLRRDLNDVDKLACPAFTSDNKPMDDFFVIGHPRQNFHAGLLLWTTIFMREHNRLCNVFADHDKIDRTKPEFADQLFDRARQALKLMLLKMTIEDYIQHISSAKFFQLEFMPEVLPTLHDNNHKPWEYTNHIAFEFNLLYRWHALLPDTYTDGTAVSATLWHPERFLAQSLPDLIASATKQPAHKFGAHCFPTWLAYMDEASIRHSRIQRLASYNAYRTRYVPGSKPYTKFSDFSKFYKSPDDVEFFVGLMCEDVTTGIFPPLLTGMVLSHAMKGIFGTPLLSPESWKSIQDDTVLKRELDGTNIGPFVARNVANISPEDVTFEVRV